MSRKRGTFLLPEEMQTTERLSTKKELAQKGRHPTCPFIPGKVRKNLSYRYVNKKPTALGYNNNALSPMYDSKQRTPYLEQVFTKFGCMGEGSFGKVYRVRSKEDNKIYAVKRLKSNISAKDRNAEVRNNEMVGFDANCVQYFMAWEENDETFMLLEYCDMSLADYSKINNEIPEELLWNVLHDMCKGLNYLHKKNLIHLDVKPGNIMMKRGFYKLGDFGLLVDLQSNDNVSKSTLSDGDSKYLAIEVLDHIYTIYCDIFGLGLTLLELATDIELPDHGPLWHQLRNSILPPEFYDSTVGVSLGLKVIVERMIVKEYRNRPTTEKILSYNDLRDLAKRDLKYPRTDFAAPFVCEEDKYETLTVSPIPFNNTDSSTTTPPYSLKICDNDSFHSRNSDEENEIQFGGRKALFSQSNDNSSFQRSEYSSCNNSPMSDIAKENSVLAQSLTDVMAVDFEGNQTEESPNCDQCVTKKIITSTPILRTRQSRRIPKAKLAFD
ncbi:protein kinase, membrane associated tyrosine/threonine 1 isoform X2 [Rhynchophorus ferrugineus]|uniref:protein kinase, membrane associated tyrosine/threonine 1 isoform X2 n=1 Tax=Rhynchophorus ferrugineus TaxID=354439 RepID=UPI003FCC746C